MKKIALFPGTFDPITHGHIDLVNRCQNLFDEIYISIGLNNFKKTMFSVEQRLCWIKEVFKDYHNVNVSSYSGLTIKYCEQIKAQFIIRGIRYTSDFEYEKSISDANKVLSPHIETIILASEPKFSSVASTIVREFIRNDGDVSMFVPDVVVQSLKEKRIM